MNQQKILSGVNFIQKSYPNWRGKVIHTNKSRKIFYPEELSKTILSKVLLDLFYVTSYTKSNHPQINNYATYSTLLYQWKLMLNESLETC